MLIKPESILITAINQCESQYCISEFYLVELLSAFCGSFLRFWEVVWRTELLTNFMFSFWGFFFHSVGPPTSARILALLASFRSSSAANLNKIMNVKILIIVVLNKPEKLEITMKMILSNLFLVMLNLQHYSCLDNIVFFLIISYLIAQLNKLNFF